MYKGLTLHLAGKINLAIIGYLIHFFLGRYLSPAMYGIVGVILTIINLNYVFLNNGVRQAVSNMIAQGKYNTKDLVKKGFLYEFVIILVLFSINFFGAPLIAQILNDPGLTDYIRISSVIIPFMGIYFTSLGILNGFKLFVIEATIIIIYPILRLLVIPFVKYVFADPVTGAEMGFIAAAVVICIIAVLSLRKSPIADDGQLKVQHRPYIKKAVHFSILFSVATVLTNFDTIIVKILSTNDAVVGYYTGAYQFGSVPFFLMAAFYLVILPVVTNYYSENKISDAQTCIRDFITVILAVVLPVVMILGASSKTILTLFYKPEYAAGAPALTFLVFGMFCLGMIMVLNTVISAANKQNFATKMAFVTIGIFIGLCILLTKFFSISGTGASTLITCLIVMLISGHYVSKIFGSIFTKKHLKIILVNVIVFILVAILVNYVSIPNLLELIAIYAGIYLGVFAIFRMMKIVTIQQVLAMLRKK